MASSALLFVASRISAMNITARIIVHWVLAVKTSVVCREAGHFNNDEKMVNVKAAAPRTSESSRNSFLFGVQGAGWRVLDQVLGLKGSALRVEGVASKGNDTTNNPHIWTKRRKT